MTIKQDIKPLLFLSAFTFLIHIMFTWLLPITDPVESNYALTAKEMLLANDYISPIIYGDYWYDKPIFTYWMLILSFKVFGFNDFAAHLPNIISATSSAAFFYYLIKKITTNTFMSFWSSAALISFFEFWYLTHAVVTDGHLLFFSMGIFSFSYLGLTQSSHKYMSLAYIFAGLAVITKGPVGIILPGIVLLAFLLYRRKKKDLKYLFSPIGLMLFLLVASPWYLMMYHLHGMDFISGFLGLHNYVRATVSEHPEQNVWYYYLLLTPIATLPWTGTIIAQISHLWKNRTSKIDEFSIFSGLWSFIVILFYSMLATKYPTYTYIALIPFAVFTGQYISRAKDFAVTNKLQSFFTILFPICLFFILLLTAAFLFPPVNHIYLFCSIPVAIFGIWYALKRSTVMAFIKVALAMTITLYLLLPPTLLPVLENSSAKQISPYIESYQHKVYFFNTYRTSLNYYSDKQIIRLKSVKTPNDVWSEGKNIMPTEYYAHIEENLKKNIPFKIIVLKNEWEEFKQTPFINQLERESTADFGYIYSSK